MAEDSVGEQVKQQIAAPFKKVTDFVSRMTGGASSAPKSTSSGSSTNAGSLSPQVEAANKASAAAHLAASKNLSYEDHSVGRKSRLTKKYGAGGPR